MREIRCHLDVALTVGSEVALPDGAANHLLRVLRLKVGASITLFNGDGHDYPAHISAAGREARAQIAGVRPINNESPLRLILAQGIARGEKMDLILQKATELGVAEIWPLQCERSEVRLQGERLQKRLEHWRGVIISACEQCGRARIPALRPPLSLDQLISDADSSMLRLQLDPRGATSPAHLPAQASRALFVIGPEGGLAAAERQRLSTAGFVGLQLGPRVLRTETAGLAAIVALQSRLGDLR